MSETSPDPKAVIGRLRSGFLISTAVNIFLVAFILGRLSTPGIMPPPFFDRHPGPQDMGRGMDMPPFPPIDAHGGQGPFGPRDGGLHKDIRNRGDDRQDHDGRPPAPPFIRDLIGPNALETKNIQAGFDKVGQLRTEFAQKLAEKPMSKEEVKSYFAKFDAVMDSVKSNVQDKAAERIASLPDDERKALARRLIQDNDNERHMHQPQKENKDEKHPPFE